MKKSRAMLGDGYCQIRGSTNPDSEVGIFQLFGEKSPICSNKEEYT